mmetsp:Transcript_36167/g.55539  ORF Transcript_36167/g.55539 Transcript_36167/m.55539 type:complete len:145 (-) Transcript_36167:12-446(-)|eukprot:CAMPEP_0170483856 /NCGR_PEP_ID=MMETSP0208-20121228/3458_1 /TAXON_ID=197538 /ORGANISM="Strombidium inclinatum, Strain S3" /LENGTH=144 /DNA_ID=CAMNT_0010757041 /DNA_START=2457 /DNA_END=2891 /DNA_ORIENTATION=+
MPITDGFEACRLIRSLYQSNSLFGDSLSASDKDSKSDRGAAFLTPLLCANTGFLDDSVVVKAKEAGFDRWYCSLKAYQIEEELVPLIRERQDDAQLKSRILTFVDLDQRDKKVLDFHLNSVQEEQEVSSESGQESEQQSSVNSG